MTFRTLLLRSLRFHWRAHLGVLLGAAVGSAALIGALVVGDSVRGSLRDRALERLGQIQFAMAPQERLFRAELASDIGICFQRHYLFPKRGGTMVAALRLPATATSADGSARANHVEILGVEPNFAALSGNGLFPPLSQTGVFLNAPLARQLRVRVGDVILLRGRKPAALPLEAPVSPRSTGLFALRLTVEGIVSDASLGDFNLQASQVPPLNAFLPIERLENAAGVGGQANLILMQLCSVEGERTVSTPERLLRQVWGSVRKQPVPLELELNGTNRRWFVRTPGHYVPFNRYELPWLLRKRWQLADAELGLRLLTNLNAVELRCPRVFLEPAVERSIAATPYRTQILDSDFPQEHWVSLDANWPSSIAANAQPLLTYLANLLRAGTNATPYSLVTAAGPPWTPADLRDDEILVGQWLADDLKVKPGDMVELTYFLPESGARLTEATNRFRVRALVPMELPWADRTLMPEFPGLEKAESPADWDTAFPLVHKIRPKDELYWKLYRGTPKAFVTLAAGQKMWGNRFGNLTAIRFPVPPEPAAKDGRATVTAEEYRTALERKILATLKPEDVGLRFEPVREQALRAADQSQDFGQLFLGFSFFLIAAALLLMALLFQLGVEQRGREVGTLLALGFRPRQVRRLLLSEGVALAALGAALGALGGVGYAQAMLLGLATIWRDAVGASALQFHATVGSVAGVIVASVAVAAVAIGLTLRGLAKRPARELLAGEAESPKSKAGRWSGWVAGTALASAVGMTAWAVARGETANAATFFSAGALLLVASLAFVSAWLSRVGQASRPGGRGRNAGPTLGSLARSGCARRRKRSLATAGVLACGCFLIVSIGVFRLDADRDATRRSSGTGGFALLGEATLPVVKDLNTKAGRESFGLGDQELAGVSVAPFRVHDGDEASCLNLNRAQQPRLLGVKPELLAGRFTFAQVAEGLDRDKGWKLLKAERGSGNAAPPPILNSDEIPAVGDLNSILWALGKNVGDTLDFTDERGRPFKVRLVGAVANSILQGSLIIDEAQFVKRFPDESGHRFFLIDAPTNATAKVSAALSRALADYGLEVTPAARRLAAFNAVQNTYLGTFQVLGGLGLLLGSAGLGVVVLRNVLERRGELAVLLAVGFRRRTLRRLVLSEHAALLAVGLGAGGVAAAVAVLPSLLSPAAQLPWVSLALTLAGVWASGVGWTWLATRYALRGSLLEALRNE